MEHIAFMKLVASADEPNAGPAEEAQLCRAAMAGDRIAWNALVTRHHRRLLVSLLADGHSFSLCEELAQEAWTLLWERRSNLQELKLPGLVVRQARFLSVDRIRRARLEPKTDNDAGEARAAVLDLADARMASRESLQTAMKTLETFASKPREVFRLAHDEELAHEEVARRVGLSVQRVRQILWELRRAIRAALVSEER